MKTNLKTTAIKNIWTRIFYSQTLNYEIFFEMEKGERIVYGTYSDYQKYRSTFDKLLKAKASKQIIEW